MPTILFPTYVFKLGSYQPLCFQESLLIQSDFSMNNTVPRKQPRRKMLLKDNRRMMNIRYGGPQIKYIHMSRLPVVGLLTLPDKDVAAHKI